MVVSPLLGRGPNRDLATLGLMTVPFVGAAALATPAGGLWVVGTGALATAVFFGVSHQRALLRDANLWRTFAAFMLGVAVVAAVGTTLVRFGGPLAMVLTFLASIATGYVGVPLGSRLWLFVGMRRQRMARSRCVPRRPNR
jgi:hypothetical protein